MNRFSILLLICVFIVSCSKPEYPGFSKSKDGFHYKLIVIGEIEARAQVGDYCTMSISYKTMDDSVFFKARRKMQISAPEYKGSIDACFLTMSPGDRSEFIISANDFFGKTLEAKLPKFFTSNSKMKVEVDMEEIQTEVEFIKEKERFLSWINDFEEYEKTILKQFIEEQKITSEPLNSGMYLITTQEGNGIEIERGDSITVHYEGKFLNGKFFDSTVKRKEPFKFAYGTKWQVIEGIEKALGKMQEKQKALVILPSDLAFGEDGSSTGIVPPMTSVIYEVEVLEVMKMNKSKE